MNAKQNRRQHQGKNIRQEAFNQDAISFFNVLTAPELFDTLEAALPDHRERLFPPTETLSMFLAQAMDDDRSCQRVVNEASVSRFVQGLAPCSTHTGGYCRARKRLPTAMVSSLVCKTSELMDGHIPRDWRWQGRSVRIIDGTTVTLADTPANQKAYPQQHAQKPGLGFPICRIVGATCLASGAIISAAMGPYKGKGGSEHALLRSMLPGFKPGDILLGDAIYGSYFALAECKARSIDVVFEQNGMRKRKTDFRKGKQLGARDHLVRLTKPKQCPEWMKQSDFQALPDELTIREIKIANKILITSLIRPSEAPRKTLKNLYSQRWHVELDIRNIKTTLGMETLTCRSPDMAEKEMWIYFLAYNLIRIIMAQSARLAEVLPRALSFKHTLQLWLAWSRRVEYCNEKQLIQLFKLVGQQQVGNRPGRVEPRAVKRRSKPFSLLTKPRKLAQEGILKNGHPPKQREWKRTGKISNNANIACA